MKNKLMKKSFLCLIAILILVGIIGVPVKAKTKIVAPEHMKVSRYSNDKLRIRWSKVKKADGYILYKYNAATKKYKRYKTLKGRNNQAFIDEIGNRKVARYRVSAYKVIDGKKEISQKSYAVRARTYKQGDKKVNVGKVKAKALDTEVPEEVVLAYYKSAQLSSKVKASKFSIAKGKKVLSEKVRWYTTNPAIAQIDQNGKITAQARAGKCYVYARSHNGKRSNKIPVYVENYAKPDKEYLDLDGALASKTQYMPILLMFTNYYDEVTDIAEYFYINQPKAGESFTCRMENGKITMKPENYVPKEIERKIYKFVDDFPYEVRIRVNCNYVRIVEMHGITEENKKAGPKAIFKFDPKMSDASPFDEKYQLAKNWIYGDFAGI